MADEMGRPPLPTSSEPLEWLSAEATRLQVKDAIPKPLIQGRDLIALGMKPGVEFGVILKKCFEAQLDGEFIGLEEGRRFLHSLVESMH